MGKVLVTKAHLDNLEYDRKDMTLEPKILHVPLLPTVLVVFAESDLNAAAYHLAKSLEVPFNANAIATVLLQESVRVDFIGKLQALLKPNAAAAKARQHSSSYVHALKTIERLGAETITVTSSSANSQVAIVCDITHEQLGSNVSGIVTLHTFRTAKEAINLCVKETTVDYTNVSVWHQNHACAYELIAALPYRNFFINCNQVSLALLSTHIESGLNYVTMENSYHYETFPQSGVQKTVVFPIGTIFAN